jgi:AP2 domain
VKLKPHRDSRSGVRGVDWRRDCRRWRAQIYRAGRKYHLGYFDLVSDAAAAYMAARSAV